MADRRLVKHYLREAKAQAGAVVAEQLAWLEKKRCELGKEVEAGDVAVLYTMYRSQSQQSRQGISARERLDAVMAAMEQLEEQEGLGPAVSRPTLLGFRTRDILT